MPWQAGEPQRSERCWETATQQIMPASLQSRPGKGNLGLRSCRGNSSLSPKASLGCEGWEQGETGVSGHELPTACSVLGEEKAGTAWQRCWAGQGPRGFLCPLSCRHQALDCSPQCSAASQPLAPAPIRTQKLLRSLLLFRARATFQFPAYLQTFYTLCA